MIIRRFRPQLVHGRIEEIDLDALWDRGLRGLVLDLDNTLVAWDQGVEGLGREVMAWIEQAKQKGFGVCIASNGLPARVGAFAEYLGIQGFPRAIKPTRGALRRALTHLRLTPQQVAIIGDQLFTDVWGGNRMGFFTILLRPLSEKELGSTKVVRKIERRVLKTLKSRGLLEEGSP